jgi:hypothetical protein
LKRHAPTARSATSFHAHALLLERGLPPPWQLTAHAESRRSFGPQSSTDNGSTSSANWYYIHRGARRSHRRAAHSTTSDVGSNWIKEGSSP